MKTKVLLPALVILVALISGCVQQSPQPAGVERNESVTESVGGQIPDYLDDALAELELTEDVAESSVREFSIIARQWEFQPDTIEVKKGDNVTLHVKSVDVTHGIYIPDLAINANLEPNETVDISFVAENPGTYEFICSVWCGSGHEHMKGKIIIK